VPLSDGAGEVAARRIDCFGTRSPQRGQKRSSVTWAAKRVCQWIIRCGWSARLWTRRRSSWGRTALV